MLEMSTAVTHGVANPIRFDHGYAMHRYATRPTSAATTAERYRYTTLYPRTRLPSPHYQISARTKPTAEADFESTGRIHSYRNEGKSNTDLQSRNCQPTKPYSQNPHARATPGIHLATQYAGGQTQDERTNDNGTPRTHHLHTRTQPTPILRPETNTNQEARDIQYRRS